MVTKHYPFVGRYKIAAVIQALCRRCASIIDYQHGGGNPRRVKAIGNCVNTKRSSYKPKRVDVLAAIKGNATDG